MTSFTIGFEEARGVLLCCLTPNYDNADAAELCAAMTMAVADARMRGSLRFLWDNRAGKVFSEEAATGLWRVISRNADPADRIAILVSNSVAKVASRAKAGGRGETFASENAAYVWLSVGATKPAPVPSIARAGLGAGGAVAG